MAIAAALGVGLGVASAVSGWSSSRKNAEKSKQLANWNAHYIGMEMDEEIRKLEKTYEQTKGYAAAQIGSSGLKMETKNQVGQQGSNEIYMKQLEDEFKNQRTWMEKAKINKQRIARMGGSNESSLIKSQGTQNLLNTGTSILGFFK